MIVSISNGELFFGTQEVFHDLSFTIEENQKIALIGRNGSGKTSLLKVIVGEKQLEKGEIFYSKGKQIAYLAQNVFPDETITIRKLYEDVFKDLIEEEKNINILAQLLQSDHSKELLSEYSKREELFNLNGGYTYEKEIKTVLTGFGFKDSDLDRLIGSFSGGEKTKIAFGRLLLQKPDLLLLDEPTNHLDLKTIEWLEKYLAQYKKSYLIVSHDRTFLDNTVNIVYELEYGILTKYSGNYSGFLIQKEKNFALQEKAYKIQQKEIKRIDELIEKFRYKKNKASFAQSKIKYLERMERVSDPKKADTKVFKARFVSRVKGGKDVLDLDHLSIGYDPLNPLCEVSLSVKRGDRICVMGDNGCGKSTLLKTIIAQIKPLNGYMLFGHQIEIGYFEQNLNQFNPNKTVLEQIWDDYPDLDRLTVRSLLGAFLFSADEVFKEIAILSGGEKVRLALAELLLKEANFLILDEPTNHLDILSKETLENSLKDFDGTILFVSHDRYFIKKMATSVLYIDNKKATYYPNGYQDYIDYSAPVSSLKEPKQEINKKKNKPKSQYDLRKIEADLSLLYDELENKRNLRYEPEYYQDQKKMQELDNNIDDLHNKIAHLEEEWEKAMQEEEDKKR